MEKGIEWDEMISTGIDWQDEQHKELLNHVNTFLLASNTETAYDELREVIQFLSSYVIKHFGEEEMAMIKHSYPKYEEHKALHNDFITNIQHLGEILEEEQASKTISSTKTILKNWIFDHICKVDKELADFLASQKVSK